MYVKCAYCGKWMDVKPGNMTWVSHSLCEECLAIEMKKLEALKKPPRNPRCSGPHGQSRCHTNRETHHGCFGAAYMPTYSGSQAR